ncbi:hypothetical protein NKI38_27720 [Mesorhizobium sp. M0621]|uniref:hypothetical protein n=1 Tax=Mesorhizobium sp. M0621 TaxID=2956974 RepID=UPI00333B8DA9
MRILALDRVALSLQTRPVASPPMQKRVGEGRRYDDRRKRIAVEQVNNGDIACIPNPSDCRVGRESLEIIVHTVLI